MNHHLKFEPRKPCRDSLETINFYDKQLIKISVHVKTNQTAKKQQRSIIPVRIDASIVQDIEGNTPNNRNRKRFQCPFWFFSMSIDFYRKKSLFNIEFE